MKKLSQKDRAEVHPLMVPLMISNMAAGNISIQLGLKGKCTNVVTACASGTHCIGDALRAIQYGDADVMVAGGTEAAICPTGIAGFTALTALSVNPDPMKASRPFDQDRDGFVLGEGAGIVVLEELEHAKARGAHIYAELGGYGATGDAYHITSPAEDGEGAGMAMKLAMKEAGVAPEQIDYINAHGNKYTPQRSVRDKSNQVCTWRCGEECFHQLYKVHDRTSARRCRRCGVCDLCQDDPGWLYPSDSRNRKCGSGV